MPAISNWPGCRAPPRTPGRTRLTCSATSNWMKPIGPSTRTPRASWCRSIRNSTSCCATPTASSKSMPGRLTPTRARCPRSAASSWPGRAHRCRSAPPKRFRQPSQRLGASGLMFPRPSPPIARSFSWLGRPCPRPPAAARSTRPLAQASKISGRPPERRSRARAGLPMPTSPGNRSAAGSTRISSRASSKPSATSTTRWTLALTRTCCTGSTTPRRSLATSPARTPPMAISGLGRVPISLPMPSSAPRAWPIQPSRTCAPGWRNARHRRRSRKARPKPNCAGSTAACPTTCAAPCAMPAHRRPCPTSSAPTAQQPPPPSGRTSCKKCSAARSAATKALPGPSTVLPRTGNQPIWKRCKRHAGPCPHMPGRTSPPMRSRGWARIRPATSARRCSFATMASYRSPASAFCLVAQAQPTWCRFSMTSAR